MGGTNFWGGTKEDDVSLIRSLFCYTTISDKAIMFSHHLSVCLSAVC